jgi:hypothetical protein
MNTKPYETRITSKNELFADTLETSDVNEKLQAVKLIVSHHCTANDLVVHRKHHRVKCIKTQVEKGTRRPVRDFRRERGVRGRQAHREYETR